MIDLRKALAMLLGWALLSGPALADIGELPPLVQQAEQARIDAVRKVTPATIAVFDNAGEGGGSGVIISADGLAVTNFHVVAPCGPFMTCGLPDGDVVTAVVLGLDPPGDVALIRLLDDREYPVAEIGDSNAARQGEQVLVVGNPFLLADDLQPTITFGVLSGVGRYQYPADTILEYADCLQTDAAINPGNSGGPLYNLRGELIGINGRGSFEKRGRVNVGVGYAISINQVMRFVSHLESGRIVDHATLGATVRTLPRGRVVIDQIERDSDAYRRGLRYGDQVLSVAGREITSANQVQNLVATYPPGWRLPIFCRRGQQEFTARVRLAPAHAQGKLEESVEQQFAPLKGKPPREGVHSLRPGYTNYAANVALRDACLEKCPQRMLDAGGRTWRLTGIEQGRGGVVITLADDRASYASQRGEFWIDPQASLDDQLDPPGSGGLLAALHLCRTLLTVGPEALQEVYYLGRIPWSSDQAMCDCLVANQGAARAEFYFQPDSGRLVGIEYTADGIAEPCRIFLHHASEEQQGLAAAIEVVRGYKTWASLSKVRTTLLDQETP